MSSAQKRKNRSEKVVAIEEVAVEKVVIEEVEIDEEIAIEETNDNCTVIPKADNGLNVYKTVVTHLINFEIIVIRVVPFTVASIDIQILTDTGHIFRTVNLVGDDYRKWSVDDHYLYTFVRENLDNIF
jgi:hypothetical protein